MLTTLPILAPGRLLKRTTSRCPVCLEAVPAEVAEVEGRVVLCRRCPRHGAVAVTIARDRRFYHSSCGSGCGCGPAPGGQPPEGDGRDPFEVLSTCVALIEIVDSCNLKCPTCYADSPWGPGDAVDCIGFEEFTRRVQGVIDRKGSIDILQLTGGEPTIHPQFFTFLEWALEHERIGFVLINTNAVRIATDEAFRERLGELRRRGLGFELYVQFDGPQADGQRELRGADLRGVRRAAIDGAGALGVPSTLAMVVTPVTIGHLADTVRFGLERPHCRGVCFQPMFTSGRVPRVESPLPMAVAAPEPITVGDVILGLVEQAPDLLRLEDFTPLPCGDPNCHTIGYLLRTGDSVTGISRLVDLSSIQGFLRDRLDYNLEDLARCGCETEPLGALLKSLEIGPDRPFRIFIKPFMDAWTFDQDRIDRCCTHVIRRDGSLDSFCRYYLHGGAASSPAGRGRPRQ